METGAPATVPPAPPTAVAGGITAEQVGTRAMSTSYQAKAAKENLSGASARADQAWTNYVPRIGLTARYTRLSDFTPPALAGGGAPSSGSLVGTPAAGGTLNPTPTIAIDPSTLFSGFSFPLVLDNYLTQATIAVPISDYFLRINQSYTAATHAEDAARFDVISARTKSYADGKVAYYTWLRARGAVNVADQSLADAKAHQKDAENQFTVGNASKVDVLRAQTQVAAAELALERAKSGVVMAEIQVRTAMHASPEERLEPGDTLESTLSPEPRNLRGLVAEAESQRPELKSIEKNAEAAKKTASAARAGRYPALSGFGDVTYANPNPRRFPAREEWFPTWSVGAQLTWSPNDFLAAGASGTDAEARAAALEAQKGATRDGVEVEVTQAFQAMIEADTAIGTTTRQLASATEGYRVATELFKNGRGTGTTLTDAEIALAQARFEHLNALVDARIARVRLEHATGRDARAATTP